MKPQPRLIPRAPLTTDRRTGGAHRSFKRELSEREALMFELNAMEGMADDLTDDEDQHYYDDLLDRLERMRA
jgi:hypothetical protein